MTARLEPGLIRTLAPAVILYGLAVRIWMLVTPVGGLDSDEAVVGLMARRILRGEFPMFFWGQNHGGPHEPLLTAVFFRLFGASALTLKVVAVLLVSIACVLIWRVGKRTVGEPAATVAGLLFWVWPAAFVWWSVKSRGFYHAGLVVGLVILLLVLRLDERASAIDAGLLGAFAATGLWVSPQTIFFTLPALLWLLARTMKSRRLSMFKLAPIGIVGAGLGALPWWIHNLANDWMALEASETSIAMPAYWHRLSGFFVQGLPGALGLKLPDGSSWMFGFFGTALYLVLIGLFVFALFRARGRISLLLTMAVAYPFLFALSPLSTFVDHPRYLYFLGPVLALLIAGALASLDWRSVIAGLVAAMTLTTVALSSLASMDTEGMSYPSAEGVRIPDDFDPLFGYMSAHGIDHVYADYWIAYYVSFESEEAIVATPYRGVVRDAEADQAVRSVPDPAYLFLNGSPTEPVFHEEITRLGVPYERHDVGGFVIYELAQNIPPESIPAVPAVRP